mmetsp:Transcript_81529/g.144390  ORF Transcript_81529/g.144390 Transcript_81529/m.144390 type:complete len:176 (+) Transcript_81529:99-626(+)
MEGQEASQSSSSSSRWTCVGCDEPNSEARSECNNCGKPRPPPPKIPEAEESAPPAPSKPERKAPTRQELRSKTVRELKDLLRAEGYNPDAVSGIEKEELVEKLYILLQNPAAEDLEPYPLASNCRTQFILRALLWTALQCFALYWILPWQANVACLLTVVGVLTVRNVRIRRQTC